MHILSIPPEYRLVILLHTMEENIFGIERLLAYIRGCVNTTLQRFYTACATGVTII